MKIIIIIIITINNIILRKYVLWINFMFCKFKFIDQIVLIVYILLYLVYKIECLEILAFGKSQTFQKLDFHKVLLTLCLWWHKFKIRISY